MKNNRLRAISLVTGIVFGAPAIATAATTAMLNTADLNALTGTASNFNQTFTDGTTSVTLNFAFTATGGTGTSMSQADNRLGIDSSLTSGTTSETSINLGETLGMSVSIVSSTVASGFVLSDLNFNVASIPVYRSSPPGAATEWQWSSDASAPISYTGTGLAGYQGDANRISDSGTFDLVGGAYSGSLTTTVAGANTNPARLGTDSANGGFSITIEAITTPIPEPSSAALLGLGGLALIMRRR